MLNNKDCEDHKYYFTLAQVKVRDVVQFCEYMGINYDKRDVYQTFNISIYQNHKFLYNDSFLYQLYNNSNQKKTYRCPHITSVEKLTKIKPIL